MDHPRREALSVEKLVASVLAERDATRLRALLRCQLSRVNHPRFFEQLKAESDRHWMVDPHISLHLADAIFIAGELADDAGGRALGLLARGNALVYLGRYQDAVDALDASGEIFRQFDDPVGWARTRLSWLVATHRLGRGRTIFPVVEEAREVLSSRQEWRHLAWLDTNTAYVAHELGQIADAERLLANAQRLFEHLGPNFAGQVAVVQANRGIMHTFLGNFAEALHLHEQARQTAVAYGEAITALRQEQNIGLVYAAQGRYTLALQHYVTAYEGFRKANLDTSMGWVTLNMLECQLALNRYQEALALAEETTAIFARHGAPAEAAKALVLAARAHDRLGNEREALACLDRAAADFAAAGLAAQEARVALERGALLLDGERWAEAQVAVAAARQIFAEQGDAIRRAGADLIHARAALGKGDVAAAEHLAHAVARQAAELDHAELAANAHHLLGNVAAAQGAPDGGLASFQQALADVERAQRALALDLSSSYLGDKLALYHDAIAISLRLGQAGEAFGYLERAKARVLADYLANNFQVRLRAQAHADPALLADLERIRAEHNWLSRRRFGDTLSQQTMPERGDNVSDAELQEAIAGRERAMGRLLDQLALARTEGLILTEEGEGITPATLATLGDEVVLFEYYIQAQVSCVFAWRGGRLTVVPLQITEQALRGLLLRWQLNLEATARGRATPALLRRLEENARGVLAMLYDALVRPVEGLVAGCSRLIAVPYGALHSVPFQALFDGQRHLIERAEVVTSPSSRIYGLCRARARRGARSALALAHSQQGQLPGTLDEARLLETMLPTEVYLESGATRGALTARATAHDVLHLATHGVARGDNPALSYLQFADGQLYTEDVCNLDLDGTMVVLSACETGKSLIVGGDEPMGLSRGFLYAGAATLVQSLWFAEDSATMQIMADFYRGLARGLEKGAALREAQLGQLRDERAHPFFWAPFQLLGDAGSLAITRGDRGDAPASPQFSAARR